MSGRNLNSMLMRWLVREPYRTFSLSSYVIEGEVKVEVILSHECTEVDQKKVLREVLFLAEIKRPILLNIRMESMFKKFDTTPYKGEADEPRSL